MEVTSISLNPRESQPINIEDSQPSPVPSEAAASQHSESQNPPVDTQVARDKYVSEGKSNIKVEKQCNPNDFVSSMGFDQYGLPNNFISKDEFLALLNTVFADEDSSQQKLALISLIEKIHISPYETVPLALIAKYYCIELLEDINKKLEDLIFDENQPGGLRKKALSLYPGISKLEPPVSVFHLQSKLIERLLASSDIGTQLLALEYLNKLQNAAPEDRSRYYGNASHVWNGLRDWSHIFSFAQNKSVEYERHRALAILFLSENARPKRLTVNYAFQQSLPKDAYKTIVKIMREISDERWFYNSDKVREAANSFLREHRKHKFHPSHNAEVGYAFGTFGIRTNGQAPSVRHFAHSVDINAGPSLNFDLGENFTEFNPIHHYRFTLAPTIRYTFDHVSREIPSSQLGRSQALIHTPAAGLKLRFHVYPEEALFLAPGISLGAYVGKPYYRPAPGGTLLNSEEIAIDLKGQGLVRTTLEASLGIFPGASLWRPSDSAPLVSAGYQLVMDQNLGSSGEELSTMGHQVLIQLNLSDRFMGIATFISCMTGGGLCPT